MTSFSLAANSLFFQFYKKKKPPGNPKIHAGGWLCGQTAVVLSL